MTALAAARLLRDDTTNNVIISTGKTAGNKWPSEAGEMWEYIVQHTNRDKDLLKRIYLEEISIDTAGNAEECKKMIDSFDYQDIACYWVATAATYLASELSHSKKLQKGVSTYINEKF